VNFACKRILVVGASGVLGANLVNQLSQRGATVVGTASNPDALSRIPDVAETKIVANLLDGSSLEAAVAQLTSGPAIDGVVLAAGRVGFGSAEQTSASDAAALMHINYLAQAWIVTALLPKLRQQPEFLVAAITGVVAEKIFPGMAAYSASKAAMSSWIQSLRLELRRQGGLVIEARPGHTETGLATRPLFGAAPAMPIGMDPAAVIARIVSAVEAGEHTLTAGEF